MYTWNYVYKDQVAFDERDCKYSSFTVYTSNLIIKIIFTTRQGYKTEKDSLKGPLKIVHWSANDYMPSPFCLFIQLRPLKARQSGYLVILDNAS